MSKENLLAIANALQKSLPGTTVVEMHDHYVKVCRGGADSVYGIGLHLDTYRKQITASGLWPTFGRATFPSDFGALEWDSSRNDYEKTPEAKVSPDRAPEKAAKDILRRVLPRYEAIRNKVIDKIERTRGDKFAGGIALDNLKAACPSMKVTHPKEENDTEVKLSGPFFYGGSLYTSGGATFVHLDLRSLPEEVAAEVLVVLERFKDRDQ